MLFKPAWKNLLSRLSARCPSRRGARRLQHLKAGYVQYSTGSDSIERLEDRALLATISWDGGGGNFNWNNAANWSGDALPESADDVVINYGDNSFTISVTSEVNIGSLQSAATVAVTSTILTLSNTSTVASLSLTNGSVLRGTGDMTVNGPMTWLSSVLEGSGTITVNGDLSFGYSNLGGRTLVTNGTSTWDGRFCDVYQGGQWINHGTLLVGPRAPNHGNVLRVYAPWANGQEKFINHGTVTRSGAVGEGTVTIGIPSDNHGLVEVLSEGLGWSTGQSDGVFVAQAGTMLEFQGGQQLFDSNPSDGITAGVTADRVLFSSGTSNVSAAFQSVHTTVNGANVSFSGEDLSFGQIVVQSGTLEFSSLPPLADPTMLSSLALINSTLRSGRELVLFGTFIWTNSLLEGLNGQGGLTVLSEIRFDGGQVIRDFALVNAGSAVWVGGNISILGDSSFTNALGASFDDQTDGTIGGSHVDCPIFYNQGLFIKSGGIGVTNLEMQLYNSGEVRIERGILNIGCGYVQVVGGGSGGGGTGTISGNFTGEVSVANPGELIVEPTPTPPTPVTNYTQTVTGVLVELIGGLVAGSEYGQIIVNGSVNLDGSLMVDLINGFVPQIGNQFVVIDNRGTNAIQGTFAGLSEGAEFTSDLSRFQITYAGSTGNDVVLTYLGVTNAPPVAHDDEVGTNEDSAVTFDVLANDTDAQDNIVASLTAILSPPDLGTLIDNGNGSFTFDPAEEFETLAAGESDQVSFDYEIMDAFGEADTATVFITISGVNDAPAVANAGNVPVSEGQTAANSGTWSDIDASDVVTLSASVGSVTKNANGTWNWSFNTADGPDDSQTVTITADDGHGGVTDTSFSLIVNNVAPTAHPDAVTVGENDGATVVNVLANDTDPAGANDLLSVSRINSLGTRGAVTLSGGQVRYSADSFFEALGANETDIDSFEYSISDGDGDSSTATVTVTITGQNDAPTANGTLTDVTVNQNAANTVINLAGKFSDVDANDSLTITAVSSSSGLVTASLAGNSLTLDYQAHQSGSANITITATDESGALVSLSFQVTVKSDDVLASGLNATIQQLVTPGKITSSKASEWSKKLDSALASYGDGHGNVTAAVNKLKALKNDIAAQTKGNKPTLTTAEANLLFGLIDELADAMTP